MKLAVILLTCGFFALAVSQILGGAALILHIQGHAACR